MAWTDAARAASAAVRRAHAKPPVYHVTKVARLSSIKKQGLLIGKLANWKVAATGKSYGRGAVYGFTRAKDAVRWAARMDWEQNKKLGSGKIAIVRVRDRSGWRRDRNDPLSQAGRRGAWVKRAQPISAKAIGKATIVSARLVRRLIKGG